MGAKGLIRVYNLFNIEEVKDHVLLQGDLSASCSHCSKTDIKLPVLTCPQCHTEFKYIAFRIIKTHIPKVINLLENSPDLKIIDFDDFQRCLASYKAKNFLK